MDPYTIITDYSTLTTRDWELELRAEDARTVIHKVYLHRDARPGGTVRFHGRLWARYSGSARTWAYRRVPADITDLHDPDWRP